MCIRDRIKRTVIYEKSIASTDCRGVYLGASNGQDIVANINHPIQVLDLNFINVVYR